VNAPSFARLLALALPVLPPAGAEPAFRLGSTLIHGWQSTALEVENTEAVFNAVWAHLPPVVSVFPTENYLYWQLIVDGRELHGNFRLAPGAREAGDLLFAYSEFEEFPVADHADRLRRNGRFRVLVPTADAFEWTGHHAGKAVRFELHRLAQDPPKLFALRDGEVFVEHTADESGLLFFLLFDQRTNRFRWLLDEETTVPDHWRLLEPGLVQGRRTGFVFRIDGPRKELAAVRAQSVDRNDSYDGPFDQLADNYPTHLRQFLERSDPSLRGKIDDLGRFTDTRAPHRVAIVPYKTYVTQAEAVRAARVSNQ
jgi:hypothetical protein